MTYKGVKDSLKTVGTKKYPQNVLQNIPLKIGHVLSLGCGQFEEITISWLKEARRGVLVKKSGRVLLVFCSKQTFSL